MDAAEECNFHDQNLNPLYLTDCALDASNHYRQQHTNYQYYEIGLFFQTWFNEDELYQITSKDSPAADDISETMKEAKTEAASMYKLFSYLAGKAHITMDDLLSVSDLTDTGKAETRERLKFWASQPSPQ